MSSLCVTGGLALVPSADGFEPVDLQISDQMISGLGEPGSAADQVVIDAGGALVLPGIVDLHGDAFERAIMPRSGVMIDLADGLADTDPQLLAAGITTAFLSITDSWEPGLRSRDTLRGLMERYGRAEGGPDRRMHIRRERCNTDDFDELMRWIEEGLVHMVSYNDHTPGGIANTTGISVAKASRTGVSVQELERIQNEAVTRRSLGAEQDDRLAELCRNVGVVTASHDSADADDLERDRRLGVAIAEFPFTIELALQYRARGTDVLLGAPNLVRGRSHIGNLSVREAVAAGAANLLCSDYHYPSLLRAPFVLAENEICSLAEAWPLVSEGPARAAGLNDRGRLEVGRRADVVVVEPPDGDRGPRVRAVIVAGRPVYRAGP